MNAIVRKLRPSVLSQDALFRTALLSQLDKLEGVRMEIMDQEGTSVVGHGSRAPIIRQ